MKDNWFEDKMNERFENFDSELDLHAAWADLEERRQPNKRKNKSGIFWWIGSGLAIVFLGIGLLFNSNKQKKLTSINESQTPTELKIGTITKQELSKNQEISRELEKNDFLDKVAKVDKSLIKKKSLEKENYIATESIDFIKENMTHSALQNLPILLLDNNIADNKTSSIDADTPNEDSFSAIVLIEALEKNISPLPNKVIHHNIECGFRGHGKKLRTFGITFNYGKAFRDSPIARGINSAYLQRRDEVETPLDAWSTQLFYQKNMKKNWFTRVNLGYAQTTDLFQDEYTNSSMVMLEDQVLQINRYPDGSTEEIKGSTLVNEEVISSGKFYQRYRQAFLGLEFGKEKYLQSKFVLRAAVGGDFTIYHNNSGNVYLDDNSNFGTYQDLNEISSTKGGIFAAKLSLEIGKSFGFNNEISFGIVGKANLKTMDTDLGKRQYLLSSLSYRKSF